MATKKSELFVVTKTKELTKYVFTVTEKSPKKFRYTLVSRMQNYCLDAVENILEANEIPLESPLRLQFQKKTGIALRKLGYFSMLCEDVHCILPVQAENISKLQAEALWALGKWIASDEKRRKQIDQN